MEEEGKYNWLEIACNLQLLDSHCLSMANEFSPVSLGALLFFAVVMREGTQWTAIFYVNVNTRLYNAMQGVICGEDDNMLTHCVTHRHKQIDSVCLGSLEMFGITTVNMQHICIINMLKKVRAKLISKQQSRCHNNNGSGLFHLKAPHSILDLNQCLTTTCGEDALTQRMCAKGVDCCLLMRTKGDHQCVSL